MKRIGTIFILVTILIGLFIVPINAALSPSPSFFAGVANNLLNMDYATANNNMSYSYDSVRDLLTLSIRGDGTLCHFSFFADDNRLALPPGNYEFGFVSDSQVPFDLTMYLSLDGTNTYVSTYSRRQFTLYSPSIVSVLINVSASANTTPLSVSVRPYLIYKNNSIDSITGAFSSVIQAPFTAVASGFNSLSDQIIGVDNLITPFGTVLVFIVSIPLIVWGLNTLIGFITRPFKRR